jgi:hypothetical protein
MSKFAEANNFFLSTCVTLLERMINTVPRGVELTEIITPIPVKPSNMRLEVANNGESLALFGSIRVSYCSVL